MSHFDAKILDADVDGMALLAAVLYTVPSATLEARGRGSLCAKRAGSFTQAFTSPRGPESAKRRTVKLS